MNPDANQTAPNASPPASAPPPDPGANGQMSAPAPPAATSAGGLKSVLKVYGPLVALFGVVFGAVYLLLNAPTPPPPTPVGPKGEPGARVEPPLRFFTSGRFRDPPKLAGAYREFPMLAPSAAPPPDSDEKWPFPLPNRLFQGVYEPSNDDRALRRVQFWFENRNADSVTMRLEGVSCTSCSYGKVTVIPQEVTKNLLQHTAVAALPLGPFNGFGVGLARPFAELAELRDRGTEYKFSEHPHATFQVPAGPGHPNPDKWAEQWGILELAFKVTAQPGEQVNPLKALFSARVDGTQRVGENEFGIKFESAKACEVSPATIPVGTLDQLSGDQTFEFFVFSSTRGPGSEFGDLPLAAGDIAPQSPGGGHDPHKFVEVLKVERVPDANLAEVAEQVAKERKQYARVRTAYKVTVVLHPKAGEHRLDIGAIDRSVAVTAGGAVHQVRLTGLLRGAVRLDDDRTDIDLGDFKGSDGVRREYNLITDKTGVEVVVVKAECTPKDYAYELVKQPDRGGRGHYKLFVTVPPGKQFGRVKGEVVLEAKGSEAQRIRIPVRSSATF